MLHPNYSSTSPNFTRPALIPSWSVLSRIQVSAKDTLFPNIVNWMSSESMLRQSRLDSKQAMAPVPVPVQRSKTFSPGSVNSSTNIRIKRIGFWAVFSRVVVVAVLPCRGTAINLPATLHEKTLLWCVPSWSLNKLRRRPADSPFALFFTKKANTRSS